MTQVCLVGDDVDLRFELLSRETSREALSTYDLREPYANSVAVETVSLGAAVSLLNDLDWYLARFVADALVLEPSVSDEEWLSLALATAVRDGEIDPEETDQYLKVYGVIKPEDDADPARPDASGSGPDDQQSDEPDEPHGSDGPGTLVEPMYVTRRGGEIPEYDLREVEETVVVRLTEAEFGG